MDRETMLELLKQNDLSYTKVAKILRVTPQAARQLAARMGIRIVQEVILTEPTTKFKKYEAGK